ncbi:hypothetical protein SDC9_196079 [bioreactor metagenome]|uniref:Uncharacterized protein n=1 Tax=bioreactor metagenome TaxID=1076179 RepID=A0A645ICB4_9ZZZZ
MLLTSRRRLTSGDPGRGATLQHHHLARYQGRQLRRRQSCQAIVLTAVAGHHVATGRRQRGHGGGQSGTQDKPGAGNMGTAIGDAGRHIHHPRLGRGGEPVG